MGRAASVFTGQTIVVTGAGAGIGRSMTLKLAAAGAGVWALDIDPKGLAETADLAARQGTSVEARAADVTDRAALARIRDEALARTRRLDVWINNAGVSGLGDFLELGDEGFAHVLAVNLGGLVNGTRVALEAMEERGAGRIVNMASVAGHLPAPFMSAYCASKHAVVGFTRALQAELQLKESPVATLLVCPGFIDTGLIAKGETLGYPEWLSFMLATPDSVADAVLKGLKAGRDEIYPTLNGRVMKRLYGLFPRTTVRSSRIMLTRSFKDFVTNRIVK